jgi:hypothetical protein
MENNGKLSRYFGTLLFVSAMVNMIGFMWGRTTNHGDLGLKFGIGLKYTMYVMVACAGYMAFVGIYHTFLAVMGWDGQPGIFSKGARSGPFSGGVPEEKKPEA